MYNVIVSGYYNGGCPTGETGRRITIMIENGFYYAACKNSERIARENAKNQIITDRVYEILRKHNTDLPTITRSQLTKAEYVAIQRFLKANGYTESLYPNLIAE